MSQSATIELALQGAGFDGSYARARDADGCRAGASAFTRSNGQGPRYSADGKRETL